MEHLSIDAVVLWRHMQRHEKELWHKRKFLMGLADMDSCDQNGRFCAEKLSIMPESMLRKDDVFYEDVKNFVEKSFFQEFDTEARHSVIDDGEELCEVYNMSKFILTLLDDLSNKGLYRLAKIMTRGSVILYKTRPQMKRVIKESLQQIYSNWDSNFQGQMQNELFQLLKYPKNVRQNHGKHTKLTRKSLCSAFNKVQLQSFPVRILYAMYRRLKGTPGVMPQLRPSNSGWSRDRLCEQVQKLWVKMIDQFDKSDKLQDPLVKAMAVPGLYSRVVSKSKDLSMAKIVHVPPEREALQNEIVKAIKSLGQRRFKKEELKNLQLLLDPESKVDVNGLRRAIKNMLTDCLFECSDMEAVPDSLIDALSLINKKPCNTHRFSLKEVIEEEVECILNVSAHMKQLMWHSVPFDKLDQDFVDAYVEDFEESDDGDIFDDDDQQLHVNSLDDVQIRFNDFSEEVASTGDARSSSATSCKDNSGNSVEFASSPSFRAASFAGKDDCRDTEISGHEMHSTVAGDGSFPLVSPMLHDNGDMIGGQDPANIASVTSVNLVENDSKQNPMSEYRRNHYVAIQEICDHASLVAYQVIGQVLADFGQIEALGLNSESELYLREVFERSGKCQVAGSKDKVASGSIIVQAVHKVIPSFPNSQLEIVKKFMNS